jgi:multidrug resistance efflux pump
VANDGEAEIEAYVQELYDTAEAELQAAQQAYQQKLSDQAAADLLEARGRVAAAQERYEIARDRRDGLLTGEDALVVQAAATGVQQAEAAVQQAEAGVRQAEAARQQAEAQVAQAQANATQVAANIAQAEAVLARAQKGVAQAQAALDQIDLQMEKLVVHAAVAGTVMTRNVQPGEVIQPGATVLTIADLDTLTVTVYLPEDQYGQVRLGEQATLTVDSFPNESFDATVTRIADQAEFTPRNVQTQEERQSTVYAVELAVHANGGKLKPGMPADVSFE